MRYQHSVVVVAAFFLPAALVGCPCSLGLVGPVHVLDGGNTGEGSADGQSHASTDAAAEWRRQEILFKCEDPKVLFGPGPFADGIIINRTATICPKSEQMLRYKDVCNRILREAKSSIHEMVERDGIVSYEHYEAGPSTSTFGGCGGRLMLTYGNKGANCRNLADVKFRVNWLPTKAVSFFDAVDVAVVGFDMYQSRSCDTELPPGAEEIMVRAFREAMSGAPGELKYTCSNPFQEQANETVQTGVLCKEDVRRFGLESVSRAPSWYQLDLVSLAGISVDNRLCCQCDNGNSVVVELHAISFADALNVPVIGFKRQLVGSVKCDGRDVNMPFSLDELVRRNNQSAKADMFALNAAFWNQRSGQNALRASLVCLPCP